MVKVEESGNFKFLHDYLNKNVSSSFDKMTQHYGMLGVEALRNATPSKSGETAACWEYRVVEDKSSVSIEWYNTKKTDEGTPIVILIQYGHATNSGVYVGGVDFINPAMEPVFQKIANDLEREVKSL